MDFDEDQQAPAWQWIIRNKAFDNVRVQRGESWVDAACRTLDELIDQKESLDKKLAKLMSDYQDVEDERDEWKARALDAGQYAQAASDSNRDNADRASKAERERDEWKASADKWHGAWQRSAPVPISSADIDRALISVISNAMNYPTPSQMLGKDTGPLRKKCVDAVCELFGIEQAVDPIEAKAREFAALIDWAINDREEELLHTVARHVIGQEDRHVDQ